MLYILFILHHEVKATYFLLVKYTQIASLRIHF